MTLEFKDIKSHEMPGGAGVQDVGTTEHLLQDAQLMAMTLTESFCPVILLRPGLKSPLTGGSGSWQIFDDQDSIESALSVHFDRTRQVPNIGVLLHPKNESRLICIDIDGTNRAVMDVLHSLKVQQDDYSWRQITGKRNGHFHIFYRWQGDALPRISDKPDGITIDSLSNGYAVVAPSDSGREPDGGGPYKWIEGHSPYDIPISELQPPPAPLIDWWMQRRTVKNPSFRESDSGKAKAWTLLTGPIGEGGRNSTLTRIAGWLRQYHTGAPLEALMQSINQARCDPPLPDDEVTAIVRSVSSYPSVGAPGHPRAVVPTFVFGDESS